MEAIYVALEPPGAVLGQRPTLTPELLAASAARTSRNNEGIRKIMGLIDPNYPEGSTSRIFQLADYGHASIKGLTGHLSVFIEDVSLWTVYEIFARASTGDGQETSTRYVNFSDASLLDAELAGFTKEQAFHYNRFLSRSSDLYDELTAFWTQVSTEYPEVMNLPASLQTGLAEENPGAIKVVDRLRRNYVFDRARVVLPAAAKTNMVLNLTARAWVEMLAYLHQHVREEPRKLAALIEAELRLAVPNLLRHCEGTSDHAHTNAIDLNRAHRWTMPEDDWVINEDNTVDSVDVQLMLPKHMLDRRHWGTPEMLKEQFAGHKTRYHPLGEEIGRCAVRWHVQNMSFAELRDLNRHRPGHKFAAKAPVGVYVARDQIPDRIWDLATSSSPTEYNRIMDLFDRAAEHLEHHANIACEYLQQGNPAYVYWTSLGTQYYFEHTATLDKLVYWIELRTGPGVHYRYAAHMRAVAQDLYERLPGLEGLILEGSAEPE